MAAKPYNGRPSWNAWNVSLWLNNDESLYRAALHHAGTRYGAKGKVNHRMSAAGLIDRLGLTRTPDGARYSVNSVALALRDMAEG